MILPIRSLTGISHDRACWIPSEPAPEPIRLGSLTIAGEGAARTLAERSVIGASFALPRDADQRSAFQAVSATMLAGGSPASSPGGGPWLGAMRPGGCRNLGKPSPRPPGSVQIAPEAGPAFLEVLSVASGGFPAHLHPG